MNQERARGNQYRATRVCVDKYKNGGVPAGRIYNPGLEGAMTFRCITQFLLCMEELLDQMRFPQPFAVARAFGTAAPPGTGSHSGKEEKTQGALATFVVRVFFRQNASWQGSVTWEEAGREESFRSALELLLLMDSALKEAQAAADK